MDSVILLKEFMHKRVASIMGRHRHIVSSGGNVVVFVLKSERVVLTIKPSTRVSPTTPRRPRILRLADTASNLAPEVPEPSQLRRDKTPLSAPAAAGGERHRAERGGHTWRASIITTASNEQRGIGRQSYRGVQAHVPSQGVR
jgi:hypothetical protein